MLRLIMIVVGIAAVVSLASVPLPGWVLVAFVLALFLMAIPLTLKRLRAENRLARTIWSALTGR